MKTCSCGAELCSDCGTHLRGLDIGDGIQPYCPKCFPDVEGPLEGKELEVDYHPKWGVKKTR